jgi:ATP-binding cassette subfamily B protein
MISKAEGVSSQVRSQTASLVSAGRLVWDSTGRWTLVWLAILTILGILPLATVGLTKALVDSLMKQLKGGINTHNLKLILVFAALMAGAALLNELLQSALEWVRTCQAELVRDRISDLVHRKSMEVDLDFYESADYYDRLHRAKEDAQNRPAALLENLGSLIQNGITLILFACVAAAYGPWLLLAIVLSMVPAAYIVIRYNWLTHKWWERTTVQRRWTDYYDQKLTMAAAAPEMRLFHLGSYFHSEFQKLRNGLRSERLRMIRQQTVARLVAAVATLGLVGSAIGVIGWRSLHGAATLGDLALCYQVFFGGQGLMRLFTANLGQVYTNSLFLSSLFQFLEMKPKIVDPACPVPAPASITRGIRCENVTFRYPGNGRMALRNLNLVIPSSKIVAVVGKNGAGKSTLVKLLSRFYDPDEGRITFDGIDVREMALDDLRSKLSILFQLPVSYDASVADNIRFGDLERDADMQDLVDAARGAGAEDFIRHLPAAYDTLLGKAFENGNELSAGQWQRVAMARAFLRQSPVVLLDEPTSFMDSWAEADWFDRLRTLCRGRTALVITHRFSIAMRADLIHLMDEGELVESGSHAELLARDGLYAQSWISQMRAADQDVETSTAAFAD